jgi:hypothetical protein
MRPKMPSFWKMSAQEIREKKRSSRRTKRATQPVCARTSKMLPMKMAENREMASAPHESEISTYKPNVTHGWNMVKRI